jgi:hypothetical protein
MANTTRVPIEQKFTMGGGPGLVGGGVTNLPQSIAPSLNYNNLIESFVIANPSVNTASIWWGDQSVFVNAGATTAIGIEIPPGAAQAFIVDETRQLYEVQNALMSIYEMAKCGPYPQPDLIPVVVWNPSNIFIVTNVAGPLANIGIIFFINVYI